MPAPAAAKFNDDRPTPGKSAGGARLDLERHIPALCLSLGGKLALHAKRHSARDLGLDLCEWRIIQVLGALGRTTIFDIADMIAMDRGGTSRAVAGLEDRGLVQRQSDPADRRRSFAALTEDGAALHETVVAFAMAREERLLRDFTLEERAVLRGMLGRLISEAETMILEQWTPDKDTPPSGGTRR